MNRDRVTLLSPGWIRLSAWCVLHNIARSLKRLLSSVYALIPVAYGLLRLDSVVITMSVVLGAVALVILYAVLRHLLFSYRVTDDSILVREGVVFKKQLDLAFARVQNVKLEHPFYFRPLGLVTMKIDGAGSSGEEVHLPALEAEEAQAIRREILARRAASTDRRIPDADDGNTVAKAADDQAKLLITRSLPDLVLHGLTNNRAWIILAGVGAVYGQFFESIHGYLNNLGIDLSKIIDEQSIKMLILMSFSAFILSVILVATLSMLGAIFSYYGFTLHGTSKSLTVQRGLFTKHEIHVQKSRIQNIYFRQDWLDLVLGRVNLIFEQISHSAERSTDSKLLVPTITVSQALELSREVLPLPDFKALDFTSVSMRYFSKRAAIFSCAYPVLSVLLVVIEGWWIIVCVPPVWCLHMVFLFMSWKRRGIAIDRDIAVVRQGIIGIDYIVIPAYKQQNLRLTQSFLMKRHGLANIALSVASRTARVPFLDRDFARQVVDLCLYQTESTNRSWM